jgi:hypothetical protein
MEPNKIENQFKSKLRQREIAPSTNAWDRLDAMLTIAEEKPKRNYNWMYVAATILGFLMIGAIFLYQTDEIVDVKRNEVVIQPIQKEGTTAKDSGNKLPSKIKTEAIADTQNQPSIKKETRIPSPINIHKSTITNPSIQNPINQNVVANNTIINQKNEQIKTPQNSTPSVEELLAKAEIKSKTENPNASVKVSANNLLSQVDQELDLSFREKVINKIDKNYKTVKVALANRNNQTIINQN